MGVDRPTLPYIMETVMEFQEAIKVLKTVCANHQGTLQDHQILQQALLVVEKIQECKEEKTE